MHDKNRNISDCDNLTEDSIVSCFESESLHKAQVFFFDETDSTNTRAKLYADTSQWKENGEPAFFIAAKQTAGRGRLGRSFLSDGRGLYMTYLFRPTESLGSVLRYTTRAAVIAARAVEELSGCEVKLKWVNDLYVSGKKLAGILAEGRTDASGKLEYMVIGIGINAFATDFPEELSEIATDIESESGRKISRAALAAKIASGLCSYLSDSSLISEYRKRSFLIGERVNVIKPTESYPATVIGIDDDSALLIKCENGTIESLSSGEVSIRKFN